MKGEFHTQGLEICKSFVSRTRAIRDGISERLGGENASWWAETPPGGHRSVPTSHGVAGLMAGAAPGSSEGGLQGRSEDHLLRSPLRVTRVK